MKSSSRIAQTGVAAPGQPVGCRGRTRERARWEWRVGEPGDPAELLQQALAEHGLPAADLSHRGPGAAVVDAGLAHAPGAAAVLTPQRGHDAPGTLCGAAVLLSAAACNLIAGRPGGPATPAPGVPDVAVMAHEHADPTAPETAGAWLVGPWRSSWTRARHEAGVEEIRRAISRGDVYQVNLVGHWQAPCHGDPLPVLAHLAALPGARHAGVLTGAEPGSWAVGCASPESLVTVSEGQVSTQPIKGTRPATPVGRAELLASAKERAEHIMIVDLERNDLSRVAETGSVRVSELFVIRRWSDLWQAESTVAARLASGVSLADLLRAVCPGGSVTGAPKLAAIDQIAALEPVGRGPSMGAFGFVSPRRVDLGLTIRTVAVDAGTAHVWAGGGITWSSDPAAEVAEASAKARPLFTALRGAALRR
ncbi:MAG: anthranilate synthase component I family protein [Micromonosporaceae bacterium]|nr:anthranilate synthase component I family protein [Micromonosporaceae bacterium]